MEKWKEDSDSPEHVRIHAEYMAQITKVYRSEFEKAGFSRSEAFTMAFHCVMKGFGLEGECGERDLPE